MAEMTPKVEVQVLPGSLFCTKVLLALQYKGIKYSIESVHPAKLKKQVPAPHLVPVMRYNDDIVPDIHEILKYIDDRHAKDAKPLFLSVQTGQGGADEWATVDDLEMFAHDNLSMLYYYFGGISKYGQKNVTKPFVRKILPGPVAFFLPFLPVLGAKAGAKSMTSRVEPVLGKNVIANDDSARKELFASLYRLEAAFKSDDQTYFFATKGPTAADFGVFVALKRLIDPLPDVAQGMTGGFPAVLKDARNVPRLTKFFEHMDSTFYNGKIDWTDASAKCSMEGTSAVDGLGNR